MTDAPNHDAAIDGVTDFISKSIDIVSSAYPAASVALAIMKFFIKREAANLKEGIATGTIVSDGQGGFVPSTNSHYDPKTGKFI